MATVRDCGGCIPHGRKTVSPKRFFFFFLETRRICVLAPVVQWSKRPQNERISSVGYDSWV